MRQSLLNMLASMKGQNYFEVLGVPRTASREEIKQAYFAKARLSHPDKHKHTHSHETRAVSQQIYTLLSTAYDTLSQDSERAEYVQTLSHGSAPAHDEDVGKLLKAEAQFQKGEQCMRSRHFSEAFTHFQEAMGICPNEGEFHAWAGWALFCKDASEAREAMVFVENAIALSPTLDKGHLFLGKIYRALGRPDRAERSFEKAIQCNPDCTEALAELRLIEKKV